MARGGAAAGGGPTDVYRPRVRGAGGGVPGRRFQRRLCRRQLQPSAALVLQAECGLGCARGVAAAVGAGAVRLDRRGRRRRAAPAAVAAGPGAGGDGAGGAGLSPVPAADLEPLCAAVTAAAGGWWGSQSAVAGFWPDRASAAAVHGLCRARGALCLRHRRAARGPAGRRLGALDAALDQCRLGVSDPGHHARQLVGLLRAGLGWLVVLGSGRECLADALAAGHGAGAFAGGDREARPVARLDPAARHLRLRAEPARHLPGALRGADLGACLCRRSHPRRLRARLSGRGHRRLAAALRAARAGRRRRGSAGAPARRRCWPTTHCWW